MGRAASTSQPFLYLQHHHYHLTAVFICADRCVRRDGCVRVRSRQCTLLSVSAQDVVRVLGVSGCVRVRMR